jgi:dTMP kinase
MFIVIDGIDGAGSETQGNLVSQKLQEVGKTVSLRKYPHYDNPIGKTIRDFLYENKDLPVEQQFLLYSLQFITDKREIEQDREKGIVIADRYFTTTLVFQTLQGMDEDTALRFAQDFGIIVPDRIFFLDVKPETAYKWKHGEDKELNFWEKDLAFMQKTYQKFQDLSKRNVFSKWIRINGEQSKEKVTEEILQYLK